MRHFGKQGIALLLAACLLLGLTACGSSGKGDARQLSGTVYVPQFMDFDLDIDYIERGCADEEYVYIVGQKGVETEETETDPETGEIYTYSTYNYYSNLYRIPLAGGGAEKMENYDMSQIPEKAEGGAYIQRLDPGENGTIWVTEEISAYTFNLPDDFDENTDDRYNYTEDISTTVRRQLDGTGAEIARVELGSLRNDLGVEYINSLAFDRAGNIFVNTDPAIIVLNAQRQELFRLEGENLWGDMILLGTGEMGLLNQYYDEEAETSVVKLRAISLENKDWGTEYNLPSNVYSAYPGGGDYLFYYQNNDTICGYKADSTEGENIFSWIDSNINRNNVEFFSFLSDGRIVAVTREWVGADWDQPKIELAILTATDRSDLPEKTDLVYATMWLSYDTRNKIIDFNKTSDKYRINVRDYSQYNTGDDSSGLTRLNTEIVAGTMFDILDTGSLPIRQYAAKGLLEDLWPFIENDPDLGRDKVMEHVLETNELDGKLYDIFNTFSIRTVVGPKNIVGDRMSWTLADLQDALAKMPEGCAIFGQTDTKADMLRTMLARNADSFVDWETGECHFDSDNFKALLEFCNRFPAEFSYENVNWDEWEDDMTRLLNGKQMLAQIYLSDLSWSFQQYRAIFQDGAAFVGYPTEDGSVGSSFQKGSSVAIASSCKDKDGAWSFIRQTLLPVTAEGDDVYAGQFYINKQDFDAHVKQAMTPNYELDENGEPVLDENGQPVAVADTWWVSEDVQIEMHPLTQEEYDEFLTLYNAIDAMVDYDTNIYDIVNEVAGAYFSGDRSLEDTAAQLQSRVKLYVNENR